MKAESCYELVNLDLTIVSLKYVNIISVFAFFVQFNFKKDNDLKIIIFLITEISHNFC